MKATTEPGAWQRLRRNKIAMTSLALLVFITLAAIFGPMFIPASHKEVSALQFDPPSAQHWFGTDLNGRDVLYRVLEGARISLLVGVSGALIAFFIGTSYGLISGYVGGKTDATMMRIVDVLYSIPRLIIIIIFSNLWDPNMKSLLDSWGLSNLVGYSKILILIISLGLIEWLTMARIVRGQVLAVKASQFVDAARTLGQSHSKILLQHLLPNIFGVVIIYLTLTIPAVILDEAFLSFLGLGVQAPQASWGVLLKDGAEVINPIKSNWWLLVFPALAMSLTLLSLNFLGDALRDALDPRERR